MRRVKVRPGKGVIALPPAQVLVLMGSASGGDGTAACTAATTSIAASLSRGGGV